MLKLWKVNAKAGDATVKYPFAPFPTNKYMRGKPEHNAELCIACGACGVACPADAIRMDTDLAADTITWSIDYGRCIFCGRCEEACPMEAIQECKRELDALRAASAVKTGNAHGMAANETLASGEPQGPGMEYLGGHGVNPEYIDRELNPDAPEIPAGPAPVEGIIMDFDTKEE